MDMKLELTQKKSKNKLNYQVKIIFYVYFQQVVAFQQEEWIKFKKLVKFVNNLKFIIYVIMLMDYKVLKLQMKLIYL